LHQTSPLAVGSRRTEERFPRLDLHNRAHTRTADCRERVVGPRDRGRHASGTCPRCAQGLLPVDVRRRGRQRQIAGWFADELGQVGDVAPIVSLRHDVQHAEHHHLGGEALACGYDDGMHLLPPRVVDREGRQHSEERSRAVTQDERDPTLRCHRRTLRQLMVGTSTRLVCHAW
jgi:hypothetical protein